MFLNFAKFELGFEVSPTFLLIDRQLRKSEFLRDTKDIFVTKRFDDVDRDYFEINALLGYSSKEKYNISVEEIFKKTENYLDEKELEKLAKYYYFNFLVGNGDAHAKNFSVIKKGNIYKLSPLYDVVNTDIYGFNYSLGIPLRKTGSNENFTEKELIDLLSDYADVDNFRQIREIVEERIEQYINITPFEEFERGEIAKRKLLDFLQKSILNKKKRKIRKTMPKS